MEGKPDKRSRARFENLSGVKASGAFPVPSSKIYCFMEGESDEVGHSLLNYWGPKGLAWRECRLPKIYYTHKQKCDLGKRNNIYQLQV